MSLAQLALSAAAAPFAVVLALGLLTVLAMTGRALFQTARGFVDIIIHGGRYY